MLYIFFFFFWCRHYFRCFSLADYWPFSSLIFIYFILLIICRYAYARHYAIIFLMLLIFHFSFFFSEIFLITDFHCLSLSLPFTCFISCFYQLLCHACFITLYFTMTFIVILYWPFRAMSFDIFILIAAMPCWHYAIIFFAIYFDDVTLLFQRLFSLFSDYFLRLLISFLRRPPLLRRDDLFFWFLITPLSPLMPPDELSPPLSMFSPCCFLSSLMPLMLAIDDYFISMPMPRFAADAADISFSPFITRWYYAFARFAADIRRHIDIAADGCRYAFHYFHAWLPSLPMFTPAANAYCHDFSFASLILRWKRRQKMYIEEHSLLRYKADSRVWHIALPCCLHAALLFSSATLFEPPRFSPLMLSIIFWCRCRAAIISCFFMITITFFDLFLWFISFFAISLLYYDATLFIDRYAIICAYYAIIAASLSFHTIFRACFHGWYELPLITDYAALRFSPLFRRCRFIYWWCWCRCRRADYEHFLMLTPFFWLITPPRHIFSPPLSPPLIDAAFTDFDAFAFFLFIIWFSFSLRRCFARFFAHTPLLSPCFADVDWYFLFLRWRRRHALATLPHADDAFFALLLFAKMSFSSLSSLRSARCLILFADYAISILRVFFFFMPRRVTMPLRLLLLLYASAFSFFSITLPFCFTLHWCHYYAITPYWFSLILMFIRLLIYFWWLIFSYFRFLSLITPCGADAFASLSLWLFRHCFSLLMLMPPAYSWCRRHSHCAD